MSVKTNVVPVTSYLEPWLPCSDWLVKLLRDCARCCRCCQALCTGADVRLRAVRGAAEVSDTRPGSREVMVNQLKRWSEVMAGPRYKGEWRHEQPQKLERLRKQQGLQLQQYG